MASERTNTINLRKTHPNLYRSIMTFAAVSIGLGLNFWLANPTFNPYNIQKEIVGSIFLSLGLGKVIFLNFWRNLWMVRTIMGTEVAFMMFWGVGTTITFFQGKTSLQLFCLYVGLSVFEVWLLLEPFANPLTGHHDAEVRS